MMQNIENNVLFINQIVPGFSKLCLRVLLMVLYLGTSLQASMVEIYTMSSGPTPYMAISNRIVTTIPQSATVLSNVPTSSWTYCFDANLT